MLRRFSWIAVGFLIIWQFGCGDATIKQQTPGTPGTSGTPGTPGTPPPANISISPGSAMVGSPDVILTISALNNFTFHNGIWYSNVLWSQDGVDTLLVANFVSSSQLTAL